MTRPFFLRLTIRPWGLLTAGGAVVCTATVLGFLGRLSWALDLFSHFRVQYLVGLGALTVILATARRWKTTAVLLLFACINLAPILPLYIRGTATAPEGSRTLRAMLINVNTRTGDASLVRRAIQANDPDILVLEEISAQWMRELLWLTNSLPHSCIHTREDNFGIGLFSTFPLVDREVLYIGEADVPSILATVVTGSDPLRVIATHPLPPVGAAYTSWRNEQLARLPDHVDASQPTLLIGDLNVTPWNYNFRRLLKQSGLRDSARGHGIQPTWPSHNPLLLIPLDHCLHSPSISIIDRKVGQPVSSDHYPLIVDFVMVSITVPKCI